MGQAKRKKEKKQREAKEKGIFSEYLNRRLSPAELEKERKKQLSRIASLRGRAVMAYASDFRKSRRAPISLSYEDLVPFQDQIEKLNGHAVDLILETPGGSAEVAEDILRLLRDRFDDVSFIVPGWAKSAGTILVMGGDEILMGPGSALGPIDAQIEWKDKVFSAEAFLEGLKEMKREAADPDVGLNRAHIPILQQISPGEIQHAQNALKFARQLVAEWLARYKFRDWNEHRSSGNPVTPDERKEIAGSIAKELCKHQRWLSHGRSIKIEDLRELGLQIEDYSEQPELEDAIRRYHVLLQITFESNIYKIYETPTGVVLKFHNPRQGPVPPEKMREEVAKADGIEADVPCPICKTQLPLQLKLKPGVPDNPDRIPYPKDDTLVCPNCGQNINLGSVRREIEGQIGRKVVFQ